TTACALTTVATAAYPNHHAATGWFTHLPEFGTTAVTLPFLDRFSHRPLTESGLGIGDMIDAPPVLSRFTHEALTLSPESVSGSLYNRFGRGGTAGAGYRTTQEAIDRIIEPVTRASGPTY